MGLELGLAELAVLRNVGELEDPFSRREDEQAVGRPLGVGPVDPGEERRDRESDEPEHHTRHEAEGSPKGHGGESLPSSPSGPGAGSRHPVQTEQIAFTPSGQATPESVARGAVFPGPGCYFFSGATTSWLTTL